MLVMGFSASILAFLKSVSLKSETIGYAVPAQ
jgi:hypothetical protein